MDRSVAELPPGAAGDREQPVDPAERRPERPERRDRGRLVPEIRGRPLDATARLGDRRREGLGLGRVRDTMPTIRALGREPASSGCGDAAGARDDDDPAGEAITHGPYLPHARRGRAARDPALAKVIWLV